MKKVLSLTLALVLALSLGVAAFAADGDVSIDPDFEGTIADFDVVGGPFLAVAPGAKLNVVPEADALAIDYDDFLDDYTFTSSVKKGEVASITVKEDADDDTAYIQIALKKTYAVTMFDLKVELRIRDKSNGQYGVWTLEGNDVGYAVTMVDPDDLVIDASDTAFGPVYDYDDVDTTRNEFDVIYGGVFEANYKGVESGKKYLGASIDATTDLYKAYEDIDFEEINFFGAPTLAGTATCKFYTDDDKVALYTYADGKLTAVAGATYNKTEGCWTFSAKTLGHYVAADKVVTIVPTTPVKPNPGTGVNGFVNLAVVAAVVSLAAAGAVALKK